MIEVLHEIDFVGLLLGLFLFVGIAVPIIGCFVAFAAAVQDDSDRWQAYLNARYGRFAEWRNVWSDPSVDAAEAQCRHRRVWRGGYSDDLLLCPSCGRERYRAVFGRRGRVVPRPLRMRRDKYGDLIMFAPNPVLTSAEMLVR